VNILLDTHIWVWLALGDDRLDSRLKALISRDDTVLWLSPISVWEVSMLCRKGRLKLKPSTPKWVNSAINKLNLKEATLSFKAALMADDLKWDNQDPADRIIVATAIDLGLSLATADQNIHKCNQVNLA
jgi:PIN domain nuclease of toxin-antitoxin system